MGKRYLSEYRIEDCGTLIREFYYRFFFGNIGYAEGANITISASSGSLMVRRKNTTGTTVFFEEFELEDCTQFWVKNGEVIMSEYTRRMDGETTPYSRFTSKKDEMIEFIKTNKLIPDYWPS